MDLYPRAKWTCRSAPSDALPGQFHIGCGHVPLVALILNQGNDHAVQIEEEHDEMEAELDKGLLWRVRRAPEILAIPNQGNGINGPFCGHSVSGRSPWHPAGVCSRRSCAGGWVSSCCQGGRGERAQASQSMHADILLDVPREERGVEEQGHPVSIDEEQESQEAVDRGLGDNVRVEPVAEVDGVDVVAVAPRGMLLANVTRMCLRRPANNAACMRAGKKPRTIRDRCT